MRKDLCLARIGLDLRLHRGLQERVEVHGQELADVREGHAAAELAGVRARHDPAGQPVRQGPRK